MEKSGVGEIKKCNHCLKEMPATYEYFHRRTRLGKVGFLGTCKVCRKQKAIKSASSFADRIRPIQVERYRKFKILEQKIRASLRTKFFDHGGSLDDFCVQFGIHGSGMSYFLNDRRGMSLEAGLYVMAKLGIPNDMASDDS